MNKDFRTMGGLEQRVLIAIASADSLGLPFENLRRPHVKRLMSKTSVRQIKLPNGKALVSDDTEHALMTARALSEAGEHADLFERSLSRQIARWCMAFPPGIGRATLRSSFRMICGVSPRHAGVKSAGNGPLMRVPVIAIRHRDAPDTMKKFVGLSTSMTHIDPRATAMAQFVAEMIAHACHNNLAWHEVESCFERMLKDLEPSMKYASEMRILMDAIGKHPPASADPQQAMTAIGCGAGVSGYIVHTAIAAIWIAVRARGDVQEAINLSIEAGGDTDSLAVVAAAITACSPDALMPNSVLGDFAGSFAGRGRILSYAGALSPRSATQTIAAPEPSVGEQFRDNIRSLRAMVRHIFWRRMH
eukprot:GHVR01104447.1.p1 GENE.GHVR01104447.1~~GHVR01104447.1.p1  ORF type:complete len:361 (-),score=27.57 GHVR01104447.1:136-1218(-)